MQKTLITHTASAIVYIKAAWLIIKDESVLGIAE